MIRVSAIAALGVAALAFSLPVAAQMSARNAYIGASVGQAKYNDWCGTVSGLGSSSCDDKDTAFRLFAGYQFHPNIAVEVGYADLGKATFSGTFLGVPVTGKDEFTAWDLVAVGSLPFGTGFSAFGKLGLYHGKVDATANVAGARGTASDTGTDLTLGLGVGYDFTRNLGVRAEWQRYNDFSDAGGLDVFSLGVVYRFR